MHPTKTGKSAGRTRSAEKHQAILTAALELLAAQGYVRMTLDQVATAADVSKSTIHLRWKTKADLLTAALATLRMADAPPPSSDIRTDLVAILEDFAANMERVNGIALIGTCLAEEAHTPELITLLRERTIGPRRALLRQALEQALDRGEIREDADLEAAVSALHGSYFSEYLVGRGGRPEWAERIVDFTLAALRTSGS
jgi:AcrR family transcriptional regulator